MRRFLAAVCAVLTIGALGTACSSGHGHTVHGRVISKDYDPARTTWTWKPTSHRTCTTKTLRIGKKSRSTTKCRTVRTGRHRAVHRTPACWLLQLNTGATVCVTATRWHHTRVGDRYPGSHS